MVTIPGTRLLLRVRRLPNVPGPVRGQRIARLEPCLSFKSISYRIDASDTIVSIDDAWFDFARRNGFARPDVVGSSLWSHISDRTTAHLYQVIIDRVRAGQPSVHVTFRCDAPTTRRFMLLETMLEENGAICFRSVTRKTQRRSRMPLLDVTMARSADVLTMCSWCKRVAVSGQWVEVELAVERLRLFSSQRLPQITHSICPPCATQFESDPTLSP